MEKKLTEPIITKKYHFCASHKYGNDYWSEEKNLEVFGKDYNTHGHNYVLEVSVSGPIDPDSGWLVDLTKLNAIVKSKIVDIFGKDCTIKTLFGEIRRSVKNEPKFQRYFLVFDLVDQNLNIEFFCNSPILSSVVL